MSKIVNLVESFEGALVEQALLKTEGNRSKTAKLLGIIERTLFNKIKKYGLTESKLKSRKSRPTKFSIIAADALGIKKEAKKKKSTKVKSKKTKTTSKVKAKSPVKKSVKAKSKKSC